MLGAQRPFGKVFILPTISISTCDFKACCKVICWYGEKEKKDHKLDIAYMKKHLLWAEPVEKKEIGHAEFFTVYPDRFVKQMLEYVL